MTFRLIDFSAIAWQAGGHPLERKKPAPDAGVTLLEFEPGFADPNPCLRGHAGIVLDGELALTLQDGREVRVGAGNAFQIDPGTAHRARNPADRPVRLFVYSFG